MKRTNPKRRPANSAKALAALNAEIVACRRCPRLIDYCADVAKTRRRAFRDFEYWGLPVPSFGDPEAPLMLLGLAPAAHGANRTGRMFTGDGTDTDRMGSSEFLMRCLHAAGMASLPTSRRADDGLELSGIWISAIVHCAPPANKPTADEIRTCASWLDRELDALANLRVVMTFGKLSYDRALKTFEALGAVIAKPRPKFGHGAEVDLGADFPTLVASYHPSRQNTQTKRLTEPMFIRVLEQARDRAAESR